MKPIGAAAILLMVSPLLGAETPATGKNTPDAGKARHLIYLHGRIVQERQVPRPEHPEYGVYELERILAAFRERGFTVSGEIRPKASSVSESADWVVEQVRSLLRSGVSADHIAVVGASMGASIAYVASARLENPDVRFAMLGACLSENVRALVAEEKKRPSGRLLNVREQSDELTNPCAAWDEKESDSASLVARELIVHTGLRHGFIYRPLPEWVNPVTEWATAPGGAETASRA
jgi:hypothetical protein